MMNPTTTRLNPLIRRSPTGYILLVGFVPSTVPRFILHRGWRLIEDDPEETDHPA